MYRDIPSSINEIKKEIKRLNQLKTQSVSLDYLVSCYRKITENLITTSYGLRSRPDFDLCRAQIGDHSNVSRLWYPPSQYVTSLGRMNEVNESMFYASYGANAQLGSLDEVGASVGDTVTQIFFQVSERYDLVDLLTLGHADEFFSKNSIYDVEYQVHDLALRKKNEIIKNWVNKEFIKNISKGSEHRYKKTIAIAKSYFNGFDCNGIFFPSVASTAKCINLVLPPRVADKHLIPIKARVIEVIGKSDKGFALRYIKDSLSIDADGTINWKSHTLYNQDAKNYLDAGISTKIAEGTYLISGSRLPNSPFSIYTEMKK